MKPGLIIVFLTLGINLSVMTASAQNQPTRKAPVLNHVALYVRDLTKSAHFYREVIGLDTMPEPFKDGKHAWFKTGPHTSLHVIEGATGPANHPKNHHTCFSVESMEVFIATLKQHKVDYENQAGQKSAIHKRVDGIQQIWLQDPDGYWVEINDDIQH